MTNNGAGSVAVKAITVFMKPYAKGFKKLEKKGHRASEWNDRAVLRSQQMGGTQEPTDSARRAQAASAYASKTLDSLSIEIMRAYHWEFEGLEFHSLGKMNSFILNDEMGSGKKIEELGGALTKEKHKAAGKIKLPTAIIGILTLAFCAVTGLFGTAGIIVLIGAGLVLGAAGFAVDRLFSRREAALAIWQKAAARVRGLVQNGNGDDAMNAFVQENAVAEDIPAN